MSRTATLVKNHRDKNFKHKRQEYGYFGEGDIIEIGWKGILLDFVGWIRGIKLLETKTR